MVKIFVYGTLKRGYGNNRLLKNSKYLGSYRVEGLQLWAHPQNKGWGIPHAIPGPGRITGELYEIDYETLMRLDRLEGHPYFYKRQLIKVNNQIAWIYIGKPSSSMSLIESGIY